MLPYEINDGDVEIVDQNENSPKRPDGDDEDYREASPIFVPNEEQNMKEVKVLITKDKVALRIITMDVPFLCNEYDIVTTIFSDARVLRYGTRYKIFQDNTEQRVEMITINDPRRNYQYRIDVQSMELKEEQAKSSGDCQIVEIDEDDLPKEIEKCPTPESIDLEETFFEEVSLEGIVLNQEEDEKFYSCLDAKNDIYVKESQKITCLSSQNDSCDDLEDNKKTSCPDVKDVIHPSQNEYLFAMLSQEDPIQKEAETQDDDYNDDNEDIVAVAENTKSSNEIHTSKFYSQGKRELNSSSSNSRKTVQLSDSPALNSTGKSSKSPRDTILAVYPAPPARGGITIYKENYKCLGDGEYLNDVIIDFYLKYLVNEILSKEDRDRTHVFSSQFYTRLSKPATVGNYEDVVMTESQRRHMGVQRWTKNVNIFEKDFVIVPINEHHHWNLAIICFPGLVGQIFNDTEGLIRPCIMFFDSLSNKNKDRIATILRGYLRQEYLAKNGETKNFSNTVLKIRYPQLPKQSNAIDCGLYVLQYVEQFFKTPIVDYTVTPLDLSEWFQKSLIKGKRVEIATLIADLARKYHQEKNIVMPTLQFPSDIVSSDEEDFHFTSTKIRNPFHKDTLLSSDANISLSRVAGSCASAVSKMKKNDQSSLYDWMDGVRDAPSESDEHNLSLDMITFKNSDPNDFMNMAEDDTLTDGHKSKRDDSLERISDSNSEYSINSKSSKHKYNNSHKISIIKDDFSGTKSHIFRKSIFSNGIGEQSVNGTRSKRESRTETKSEQMEELRNKYQARKRRNELKEGSISEEWKNKNFKWIDTSVFDSTSSDKFSFYAVDDEPGIPASTSYQDYKLHTRRLQEL